MKALRNLRELQRLMPIFFYIVMGGPAYAHEDSKGNINLGPQEISPIVTYGAQNSAMPAAPGGVPDLSGVVFRPDPRPAPDFGLSPERWWARVVVPARGFEDERFIRLDNPGADQMAAYASCPGGSMHILARLRARYAVFAIGGSASGCTLLLEQETRTAVRFPIALLTPQTLSRSGEDLMLGCALGVLGGFVILSIYLFAVRRDILVFYYICLQVTTVLSIMMIWGFSPGLIFERFYPLAQVAYVAGLNLSSVFVLSFGRRFLQFHQRHKQLDRVLDLTFLLPVAIGVAEIFRSIVVWPLGLLNLLLTNILWVLIVLSSVRVSPRRALLLGVGYAPTLYSLAIYVYSIHGSTTLADLRPFYMLGDLGSTTVFGLALAGEFKNDRDQREAALSATVDQLRANRAQLERYQNDLEDMVSSRTLELQRLLENEREVLGQQREFTAMVGHEFRTPLAVIDGQARRIARATANDAHLAARAREIRDAARDMLNLMDGLLNNAKLENGRLNFQFVPIDVTKLLPPVAEGWLPPERLDDLSFHLDDSLPARADRALLSSALANIISNSVKYTPPGKRIIVEGRHCGDTLRIDVSDEGVGIAPNELTTVFARFQRGSNVLTTSGSGLGLYIAKQVVEGHGGTIGVTSTLGEGTCFTVTLPAAS